MGALMPGVTLCRAGRSDLRGGLRGSAVDKFGGTLCVGGGGEHCSVISSQHFQPGCDVGRMILSLIHICLCRVKAPEPFFPRSALCFPTVGPKPVKIRNQPAPVSYTHLDVYKRQHLARKAPADYGTLWV